MTFPVRILFETVMNILMMYMMIQRESCFRKQYLSGEILIILTFIQ